MYQALGDVIYTKGHIQIITKLGRTWLKWVNLVLKVAYICPHPSTGTPLPHNVSTRAALVELTAGDTLGTVTDA